MDINLINNVLWESKELEIKESYTPLELLEILNYLRDCHSGDAYLAYEQVYVELHKMLS